MSNVSPGGGAKYNPEIRKEYDTYKNRIKEYAKEHPESAVKLDDGKILIRSSTDEVSLGTITNTDLLPEMKGVKQWETQKIKNAIIDDDINTPDRIIVETNRYTQNEDGKEPTVETVTTAFFEARHRKIADGNVLFDDIALQKQRKTGNKIQETKVNAKTNELLDEWFMNT